MRFKLSSSIVLAFAASSCFASLEGSAATSCTLRASGGDDAPQFLSAVKACSTVRIPKTTTLNIETRLNMTGLSNKRIDLAGTIRFAPDIPYWTGNAFFIPFQTQVTFWLLGGKNIILNGGGTLDGAGQVILPVLATNTTLLRPIILTIFQASGVVVENISMTNGPEWHNLINESQDVTYRNININAVSTSSHGPSNTDGWNIYRSDNIVIRDSVIVNGDDCVSFKPNSTNVLVTNLNCTGSHSLGQFPGMFDIVENVTATNIRMSNAQNGARIKAWAGPNVGSGIVKNITFENFIESKCYMTNATACAQFPSNTFIQDIWFNSISGTSTGPVVAALSCSPDGRCSNINYTCQNVAITGNAASLFPTCTVT
ncbi:glycoside hydrolase family 28 protein [Lyophyllum atratum]|nr:glycoside hydrolase family 28 protein [Lyophyllum atratum]